MKAATFKPKKDFIHVPGHGVVSKVDFNQSHVEILFARAKKHKVDLDEFIKQHLEVTGFGNLPLFDEASNDKSEKQKQLEIQAKAEQDRKEAEAAKEEQARLEKEENERLAAAKAKEEEEELARLLKEEEDAKKLNSGSNV